MGLLRIQQSEVAMKPMSGVAVAARAVTSERLVMALAAARRLSDERGEDVRSRALRSAGTLLGSDGLGVRPAERCVLTRRLELRAMSEGDWREMVELVERNREHLHRFCQLHHEGEDSTGLVERMLEVSRRAAETGRAWRRLIVLRGGTRSGSIIGAVNVNDIVRGLESSGEVVFWLSAEQVGRGLGREAVGAVVEHALSAAPGGLGLDKVLAMVQRENAVSLGLIKRLGFEVGTGDEPTALTIRGVQMAHEPWVRYARVMASEGVAIRDARSDGALVRGLAAVMEGVVRMSA